MNIKITINAIIGSSQTYTIQPNDSISSIANNLGLTTQELISANPWLESEGRISADGSFILIKPGENLSLPNDKKNNKTIDVIYKTNDNGDLIFSEIGEIATNSAQKISNKISDIISNNNYDNNNLSTLNQALDYISSITDNFLDILESSATTVKNFAINLWDDVVTTAGDVWKSYAQ